MENDNMATLTRGNSHTHSHNLNLKQQRLLSGILQLSTEANKQVNIEEYVVANAAPQKAIPNATEKDLDDLIASSKPNKSSNKGNSGTNTNNNNSGKGSKNRSGQSQKYINSNNNASNGNSNDAGEGNVKNFSGSAFYSSPDPSSIPKPDFSRNFFQFQNYRERL